MLASLLLFILLSPVAAALSFILGVAPLVLATGAGAASRVSVGMTVFGGMLFATIFGVVLIPVLYVAFQRLREWFKTDKAAKKPAGTKTAKAKS